MKNGFKVGPNYQTPGAPVESLWIDDKNKQLASYQEPYWDWWRVFQDPYLEMLIQDAHRQNLTLRQAGFRIEEARARRAVQFGNLFPQQQSLYGSYSRRQISKETGITAGGGGGLPGAKRAFDVYTAGGQFAWELDFWGRFRRAVIQADAQLDSTVEDYDDVLVILLGDVAQAYVDIRVTQQRIRFAEANVRSQTVTYDKEVIRANGGLSSPLDVAQARTNLAQTEANVPQLKTDLRRAQNRLCILMGMPPADLDQMLGSELSIPGAPAKVAVGIPADLIRRRPDVRRAERLAAAQSERIGITEAAMYPAFTINGNLFVQANQLNNLFVPTATAGNVGPSFNWNLLNYGRIWNTTNAEEALFLQLVTAYQVEVLNAQRESEDAITGFLNAEEQSRILRIGVDNAVIARDLTARLYLEGRERYDRLFIAELFLTQQQDSLALAEGAVAANLVDLFRSLGGGWQIRLNGADGVNTQPMMDIPRDQLAPMPQRLRPVEVIPENLPRGNAAPGGPMPAGPMPGNAPGNVPMPPPN
ncbi:efflux transporter outer membrane subunit [Anatilimnocola floriformis]|uniref:efflux transporter outer membrane subunit n=1 Tax=Anatilimnocola floriformis TaxID=2948575 RepID=UPI0020C41186|nr:efflux transporter outer membrane subunit [Anatilimnocola floriformis]